MVAENARGLMEFSSALLNSVVGLLSGLLGGYFAGRAQIRYQLRASATTDIRRLMLDARQAFHNWILRPAYYRGPGDYHKGSHVGAKIDTLSTYLRTNEDWLDRETRASAEQIARTLGEHYLAHMEACSFKDALDEQHDTALAAELWLSHEFPKLMGKVRVSSWRRRLFGG